MRLTLLFSLSLASSTMAQSITHDVVAFTGDAIPGFASAQYTTLEGSSTSADGRIILQGYMSGAGITSANNRALWSSAPGAAPSTLVARLGDTGPSASIYSSFGSPRIASGGKVGFLGSNGNMAQVSTLLSIAGDPGSLATVVGTTMNLPGTSKTVAVPVTEAVSSTGSLLVSALLEGLSDSGLWRGTPGNLTKIATTGDAAPGLPGIHFTSATVSGMSNNGTVAFMASLSGDSAFNQSIWRWTPDGMTLILRKGSTVLAGEVVTHLGRPAVNDAGTVAFLATTSAGRGLWINSSAGVQRLVAEGQAAPGLTGWTFSDFERHSINTSGQIAFESTLKNGLMTQRSFWLRQTNGTLLLLAREGGTLPSRTTAGTVSQLLTGFYSLADNGSVVFIARLGTDYGLYRARIVAPAKVPPVVKLSAKLFRTTSLRARLRGTASSSTPLSRVMVRPAAAKNYTKATGTGKWSIRVKVPKGRSKAYVQAIAKDGTRSKVVAARILRTK